MADYATLIRPTSCSINSAGLPLLIDFGAVGIHHIRVKRGCPSPPIAAPGVTSAPGGRRELPARIFAQTNTPPEQRGSPHVPHLTPRPRDRRGRRLRGVRPRQAAVL